MPTTKKIAVLGGGNGGQAIAGYLATCGHRVALYNRTSAVIDGLRVLGGIALKGQLSGFGMVQKFTSSLVEAIDGAEIIMVATVANAHAPIAREIAAHLKDGQIIILNPGRTGGALEFRECLRTNGLSARVYVAEAQSLMYACRVETNGTVNVVGVKEHVPLATAPSGDVEHVIKAAKPLFSCFVPAANVMVTSLENIGAIFHPAIAVFNSAAIERGQSFYFYHDLTPAISNFLMSLDEERLKLGYAFDLRLTSAVDWVSKAYPGVEGDALYARLRSNPAYSQLKSPTMLKSRLLSEDVPMGLVPMVALGDAVGVKMPLMRSLVDISGCLLGENYWESGRNLAALGLANKSKQAIMGSL